MYRVLEILTEAEVKECREIAASAPFVDGRFTNPHNTAKQNEQLHDQSAYQRSAQLLHAALIRSEELINFAFPVKIAPPLITRYKPAMKYGLHTDVAFMQLPSSGMRRAFTSISPSPIPKESTRCASIRSTVSFPHCARCAGVSRRARSSSSRRDESCQRVFIAPRDR